MKKTITKVMAVFMSMILVLLSTVTAMAENPTEIEDYLNSTYAKAIEPYGSLKLDDEGRYIVPLNKTSVSLKKDTSSKLYTSLWSSSDESVIKVTNSNYSSSTKVTHPEYKDGGKQVTLTLSIYDKKDATKLLGSRDYVLYVEPQLPIYSLTVTAKNEEGQIIDDAKVLVTDNYYNEQNASKLKGNTEYTLTVTADGYVRDIQKITLTQDTSMEVILKKGATVSFNVFQASGSKTDYATIKVTSLDGSKEYSCVLDEYGYDTPNYELPYGEYKYYATYQSGSQTANGTFDVKEGEDTLSVDINLVYTEYKVKFNVTPANAKVTLKKNGSSGGYGDEILPDENGYYTIIYGQYRYTVDAEGYDTKTSTFNATDTSLKNNKYVITVKLTSPYDTLLNKADDYLFNESGEGLMMSEYSGVHSDVDFGSFADIDSDYEDVNITETLERKINENVKADDKFSVTVNKIENIEGDVDNSVILKDGTINYYGVNVNNYDEDYYGAVCEVSLTLSYKGVTKDSSVTVVVPYHSTSRQERLESAANYAASFSSIKGDNKSGADVTKDLDLINVADTDDYGYYSICSSWQSSNPEIIDPKTGKVTRPENDTFVKLTVKTYYSQAQLDDGGYLFDGGPLGDNAAYRFVKVLVKGTKPAETTTTPASSSTNQTTTKKNNDATTATAPTTTTKPSTTSAKTVSKPKKTSVKKLSKGKKAVTVSWTKVSGVKGYQIQLATDKKFKNNKKTVTVKKQKTTKSTVKKLKANKKYYVRVRTYKTVNGKNVYSAWSKVKTIKTK